MPRVHTTASGQKLRLCRSDAMLEIRNVSKNFGTFRALSNLSLTIEKGEFFSLLGPSGCGKTTLLRMIAGLETPDSGSIFIEGIDVTALGPPDRPCHTVFQSYALFPHLSVGENVAFPLRIRKVPKDERRKRVIAALDMVQLGELVDRPIDTLSGGQQQRDRPRPRRGTTYYFVG